MEDRDFEGAGSGSGSGAMRAAQARKQPPQNAYRDSDSDSDEAPPPIPSSNSFLAQSQARKILSDSDDEDEAPPPIPPAPTAGRNQVAARIVHDEDEDEDEGEAPPPVAANGGVPSRSLPRQDNGEDSDEGEPPPPPPSGMMGAHASAASHARRIADEDEEDEGAPPAETGPSELDRAKMELEEARRTIERLRRRQEEQQEDGDAEGGMNAPAMARAPAPAVAPAEFYSEVFGFVKGKCVSFIIDCSGSMALDFRAGYPTRLKFVLQELNNVLLKQLKPDCKFNIYSFNARPTKWRDTWAIANADGIQAARGFLSGLRPSGGGEGLFYALNDALNQSGVDGIYVLTDGCPSSWGDLSQLARGVPITCITMGRDQYTLQIMQQVAGITGGELRQL